ncbi:hypothetical protein [Aminipila luticellarii]|uniref:Sporulation integral membrane protein YlbJ n=1 Tax=Aminipila luticellarii TaxID=2507160 RepID=A0A410PV32_9FIRM|nr:hypothetical protein [Aminipila luticellarii]QAT42811.1 hypothetical protein EQM06_05950 [Aminipila luticellarii]
MDIINWAVKALKLKFRYIIAVFSAGAACLVMVIFPEVTLLSAQKGIAIWANNILPAMLPFFICANFMNGIGVTRYLNPSCFAFSLSVLSGYPMGAKIIGDMGRSGYIPSVECRRLISFCSTSGPAFIVGAVGASMIGSNTSGSIIAIAHFGGALLNGLLFSMLADVFSKDYRTYKSKKSKKRQTVVKTDFNNNYLEAFTNSIITSLKSLGIILAYIVMFMMITDMIQLLGLLKGITHVYYVGMIKGIFEMTVGCSSISGTMAIPLAYKTIGCSILISFGGLSIIGQSMSMLQGTKVSFSYLLLVKIFHSIFAGILALILTELLL